MNARIVTTATLFTAFAGILTARAADSQLLGMVMPDAKVIAGANVDQAKASPFGLFVLTQLQNKGSEMQQLIALTGFDPTRDVHEVLAASTFTAADKQMTGILLARGAFDASAITTLATSKGALTETYNGVTIIEDPKKVAGVAFINSTLAVAGDVANVKAAIDRPGKGQSLPSAVLVQVNQWSGSSDAWVLTTVPLSALAPGTAAAAGVPANFTGLLQQVQQAAAGVKFGDNVVGTAAVQTDTAQNATQMANGVQFLINLAQMQAQKDPKMATLLQGVSITSTGNSVKLTITLPQAQFQQLIEQQKKAAMVPAQHMVKK